MRWKKTVLTWCFGIIFIAVGMFWAIFGSLNLDKLVSDVEYFYTRDELINECQSNGLAIRAEKWEAEIEDASFTLELSRRARIKEIKIKLAETSSDYAQVYFTTGTEMKSGDYWEIPLEEGVNTIVVDVSEEIKRLRFDLTNQVEEGYVLENITVITDGEHKIQYYVFTLLLLIIYVVVTFLLINKKNILEWILKNEKRKKIFENFDQICALAISDFKGRFSGSYLGIFWGILQPLSTILLFWFVFQVGFRSNPIDGVPFILWLAAGMIPWNFFYDSWFSGTSTFTAYSYIVKKVVFNIEVLPLVRVMSSMILNLIFNGILVVIYCIYGRFMGVHLFDMLYFSICLFVLTLGLSYITATLNVFMKDVGQFMGIILQVLMWMTPLMWDYHVISDNLAWLYKLNPLHYVLNGYRESLISGHWFFYHKDQMIWFWVVTILLFIIGRSLMKKMKDHFADVL